MVQNFIADGVDRNMPARLAKPKVAMIWTTNKKRFDPGKPL